MSSLHIYDVSGFIHFGNYAQRHLEYLEFNVKGIRSLIREMALALADGADILLAFDSHSFRKNLFDGYKKGRERNRVIDAQIDFIYYYIQKAGIPAFKFDNYEADDIIAWATEELIDKFDSITIRANDMDITHNIRPKVIYKEFSKNSGYIITHNNFEDVMSNEKRDIYYNTISAFKVFMGCSSDKIPVFKSDNKIKPLDLYYGFIKFLKDRNYFHKYTQSASFITLAAYINSLQCLTEDDRKRLYTRIQLIFPAKKPDFVEFKTVNKKQIRQFEFSELLIMCKEYNAFKCLKWDTVTPSKEFNSLVRRYAEDVQSGAFSVDRNLEVNPSEEVEAEIMFLKEF